MPQAHAFLRAFVHRPNHPWNWRIYILTAIITREGVYIVFIHILTGHTCWILQGQTSTP